MAKSKQSAAEAEARGGSSSQDEGEEESESASESEYEEKEVENEEQEQDEDQDEGEEGSASESESECEEKEDENTIPAPLPKKPSSGSAAQHPQSSSSSSSSGESDSSPVDHCGVDPNMKMMQSNAAASASAKNKKPICNPTLKRPVVESERENRKWKMAKAENVNAVGVEDRLNKTSASKVFFQRLWSPEDEIVILEGIIHHTASTGLDPSANINDFYLSIKNSIHVHVTKRQLSDKVRKLKKKYMTNATKAKLPSKSHDQQLYNLSQQIWGFQTNAVKLDTTNNNKDVVHGKPTLKEDASNKMAEIKRELKKLHICQLKLLRRTELLCEQTKRVLESLQ